MGFLQSLAVRAAEEEVEKKPVVFQVVEEVSTAAPAGLDFSGYVAKDTAGQENIYSVEVSIHCWTSWQVNRPFIYSNSLEPILRLSTAETGICKNRHETVRNVRK